ncbi:MAG: ABC transporter permease [Chitinophagaceae bacterium]|nr:ABC transporter permease [Chitinophagaceae bacterium]
MKELQKEEENWDIVIHANKKVVSLRLRDTWRYRDLLFLLTRRDFVAFYKQTVFGPVWFFAQPIFMTITYVFIFGRLAGMGTDGIPHTLFYLTGVTAWTFFSECFTKTSTVFRDNASMFGKVYFPRIIMPLSIVLSTFIKFIVQFILLLGVYVYYIINGMDIAFTWYTLCLPIILILIAMQGLGLGMLISSMTTKYKDLSFLVTFGIQILMYATPVVYSLSGMSERGRFFLMFNPMTYLLEGFRKCLLGIGIFNVYNLMVVMGISGIILLLGVIIFNKMEKNFIDTV